MEGQTGIVMEMGTQTPVRPSSEAEGSVAVSVDTTSATTIKEETEESKPTQKQDTDNTGTDQDQTKKQSEEKTKEKPKGNEDELTPEEIEEGLDKIIDSLNANPKKKQAFEQYVARLFAEHDEDNKKGEKLVETSAELLRLIKLIFALIFMYITNPKDFYSGEDFGLSDTPPEGDEGRDLTISGQDSYRSWKNVREGVQKITEPLPFSEFMSRVLEINAANPVKKFKTRKEESKNQKILKNLMKNRLIRGTAGTGAKAASVLRRH